MRNYCRFYGTSISYQDQGPPVGPMVSVILWERTAAAQAAQVANIYNVFANQTTTINYSDQFYVLLDTDQCLYMCQQMGQFGVQPAAMQTNSPRELWFPAKGTVADKYHGPDSAEAAGKPLRSNLKGAVNLITNFFNLMTELIGKFTKLKDKRTVGILLNIRDRVASGKLSITEALVELKALFII